MSEGSRAVDKIQSAKNEYIKKVRSLKQKKNREELGLFLAEGDKCAQEALCHAKVESLLTSDPGHPLISAAERQNARVILVSPTVMEAASEVKTPQSCIAVVKKGQAKLPGNGLMVALEGVADPQNVGTILRTADAVGATGALLSRDCADFTAPKAVRAAMGSTFHLPIEVAEDFYARLEALKSAGVCLIGGHLMGEEGRPHAARTACVIIGNEARGMSERAARLCDALVRIPMYGKAESLNAAVAAGILLYACREGR